MLSRVHAAKHTKKLPNGIPGCGASLRMWMDPMHQAPVPGFYAGAAQRVIRPRTEPVLGPKSIASAETQPGLDQAGRPDGGIWG